MSSVKTTDRVIESRIAVGLPSALVTVQSFTPGYRGVSRPRDIGVVFDQDRRLADAVTWRLCQDPEPSVCVNQPCSPADRHVTPHGLPAVMIEIRNDVIAEKAGQQHGARKLASILGDAKIDLEPAGGADVTSRIFYKAITGVFCRRRGP